VAAGPAPGAKIHGRWDMPANLTPDYYDAEKRYKKAKTREERMAAIEEMLAVIPKHKGTEKLQGDLKKRLSKLRNLEDKRGGKRGDPYKIPREGAGRAVLVGAPNSGKSAMMKALTNAEPEVAPYPFSTVKPAPGMMDYEDIKIQLVDTAPVTPDRVEVYHSNLVRGAELVLCMVDLGASDPVAQFEEVAGIFEKIKIRFAPEAPEEAHAYGVADRKTLVIASKYDLDEDDILLTDLVERSGTGLEVIPFSAEGGINHDLIRETVFRALNVLRIYSKIPGKPADMNAPYVLPTGSTVEDVARMVHKDFQDNLRYARIWGSERFDGQKVQRDYEVHDKDILELHV